MKMKDKVFKVTEAVMTNPFVVAVVFATAIGAINVLIDNSNLKTDIKISINRGEDDRDDYRDYTW